MNRRRLLGFGAVGPGIVGFASMVAVGTKTITDANQKHPAAEVERGPGEDTKSHSHSTQEAAITESQTYWPRWMRPE